MNEMNIRKNETLRFSTKALTLSSLDGLLTSASILPCCVITWEEWCKSKTKFLERVQSQLGAGPFIVRSSCSKEDTEDASNAGAYLSVLDVDQNDLKSVIGRVFGSYELALPADQVLIQPMLINVVMSGVIFSHDPNTGMPYRSINYHKGSDTTAVTGGRAGDIWIQYKNSAAQTPEDLLPIITLLEELEGLFGSQPIDCEFAISKGQRQDKLWLLQARPLLIKKNSISENKHRKVLQRLENFIRNASDNDPFLLGNNALFGVMPDWNPAEIIGVCPKPLSMSLYKELITDATWAYQRDNYGYRNLRSFPLMLNFSGRPYIDIRVSFNSFIPADLSDQLGAKLVDHYIQKLANYPALHDKVEFEIIESCYNFKTPENLQKLRENGFSKEECFCIEASLKKLTKAIVDPRDGLWLKDRDKILKLQERYSALHASSLCLTDKIYWLLEDTKRYGTLPFAGLARAGFIAMQLLQSIRDVGIFSETDYENFLKSLDTVGSRIARDKDELERAEFLSIYGHLRPGTYDITSPRYDERPELYFNWDKSADVQSSATEFSVTIEQMSSLRDLLQSHDMNLDVIELLEFIRSGIELREWAKFHFSKNLSDAIELIGSLGAQFHLSKDDLAFLDIQTIKTLRANSFDPEDELKRSIQIGKQQYEIATTIKLPPVVAQPLDIWGFELPDTAPNFVTSKDITGKVRFAENIKDTRDAIAFIPNADPGFDWLFSQDIAGFVTEWGGSKFSYGN
uniref:Predicted phosphoenolpyruvate synthase/pyruvate phosphate dikinase n=1 Tax=uncultured bacterium BAC17H8 TaxID=332980 RepID=Q4JMQ0_9BACT|nr:predicted phosphoenolpyruvate synthase/pyruvate phosphate dikinase [uncultured bacterium BAC17H8]